MQHRRVYWLTGLSGAGKTTIGKALYKFIKERRDNVVMLDGDSMRAAFCDDLGYNLEDRHQCAVRYAKICRLLAEQEIIVICCTISMFTDIRTWNREHIEGYKEIYIKVPMNILEKRNQKGLYSGVKSGRLAEVAGADLQVELPETPDIVIDYARQKSMDQVLEKMFIGTLI